MLLGSASNQLAVAPLPFSLGGTQASEQVSPESVQSSPVFCRPACLGEPVQGVRKGGGGGIYGRFPRQVNDCIDSPFLHGNQVLVKV